MSKTKKAKMEVSTDILKKINENPGKFADEINIKELVKILRSLSAIYYNTGNSLVSDEIYDILKETLEKRDPENPYLSEIGAPIEKNKVHLPYPMGSLSKIKPEKENLDAWLQKYKGPYVVSDKLDGTSAQYYKEKDNEFKLYSRGNGIEGQDISHLIKFVLPSSVKNDIIPVGTSIRGEIIISKNNFKKIANKMKNARNASSGVVNSKTVDKNIAKLCEFVAYSILHPRYRQSEQFKLLEEYGFKVVNYKIFDEINNKILSEYLTKRRKESEYEVDGIVVFDDSKTYQHKEGNPDYGFAFKTVAQDQILETKIKQVHWHPSMNGYLKPTIEIEPVNIGGTTVTFATAFNAKYVVDNKLGPGAVVKIIRSGDVIPYILEVVKPAKEPQMPDIAYKWNDTGVDILLKDLYGAQADVVTIKLISHFFKTLGVEYIGEGIVTKLVNSGYKTIPDIIDALINNKEKLSEIEGIGMKIIDKIENNLENAIKNTDLTTFIAASHIFGRGFGVRKVREITNTYPDILTKKWNTKTMIENIEKIKGFSSVTATQFAKNFEKFKKFFDQVNEVIDISYLKKVTKNNEKTNKNKNKNKNNILEGLTFVFTGFRDKELEDKITKEGGRVITSVSAKTSGIVAQDKEEKSSKIMKARKLNIPIMTKEEFIEKYKLT